MTSFFSDQVLRELAPWLTFSLLASVTLVVCRRILFRPRVVPIGPSLAELTLEHRPLFGRATTALAGMFPDWLDWGLARDLSRAGYYRPAARDEFLALRNLLVAGTTLTAAAWGVVLADDVRIEPWKIALGGLAAVICVYALPRIYVSSRAERRAERIMAALPDALDSLVMALSGGLPLQLALDRVAASLARSHPDLALELEIVRRQAFAHSLDQALRRMAARIDDETLTALTMLTSHAERLGADVSSVLIEYADQMRASRMQRAEERGNRTSIKLLFPIVLCLAPAAYILLLSPPLIDLRNFRDRETKGNGVLVQGATATPQPTIIPTGPRPVR